ncbi:MAG: antitoxin VapB family protein [Nanoarchaeota archaeon]|nr:antitoxin VapB family protein [Nanoarchaeota archaeon]
MEKTTIAISRDIKMQMQEFGYKGESYSDLIKRLIESAKQRQLQELLMDEKDTVTIEEALAEAKKRWQG